MLDILLPTLRRWYVLGGLLVALAGGAGTVLSQKAALKVDGERIDAVSAQVDSLQSRIGLLEDVQRAVGVDMCLHKPREFIAQTRLPCRMLLRDVMLLPDSLNGGANR